MVTTQALAQDEISSVSGLDRYNSGFLAPLVGSLRVRRIAMRSVVYLFVLLVIALAQPATLFAQTAVFTGAQKPVASYLSFPCGVALDAFGDVFIADWANSAIWRVDAVTGAMTAVVFPSNPEWVAVDSAGLNVYYTIDGSDSIFYQGVQADADRTGTLGDGLKSPAGLALDSQNNLFVADAGNNRIVEFPSQGNQTTVVSGLNNPQGIAVDGAGDIFISDTGNNRVVDWAVDRGLVLVASSGLNAPLGIAVDPPGNVYVSDSGNSRVVELPAGGGQQTTVGSGLSEPYGVAVDANGDVFIADPLNRRAVEAFPLSVDFGGVPRTIALSYDIPTGGSVSVNVMTQGAQNQDFTLVTGNTCKGTLVAGASCVAEVTFSPTQAGVRLGAIQLVDSLRNVLASTNLRAVGLGAQIAFESSVQTTVGSGLSFPSAVAVDGAGDVYVADDGGSQGAHVVEFPAGGGPQVTVATGGLPVGLAVDGAGDLIIADNQRSTVYMVTPQGVTTPVGDGLKNPVGVAVDSAGNIFIADSGNNRVVKVPALFGQQIEVGTGLNNPQGVAVDAQGNVYIADSGNDQIVVVPADITPTNRQYAIGGTALKSPFGVAVDAAGDLFVSDYGNNRVVELPAYGQPQTTIAAGLSVPSGLAVDDKGNILIADTGDQRVLELPRSQPPALSFAPTQFATTSSDSPQTVVVQNIGNQPLGFADVNYPSDFPVDFDANGTEELCVGSQGLPAGQECDLPINFMPLTIGAIREQLTITDYLLGGVTATQSIALSGTGLTPPAISLSATSLSFGNEIEGSITASQTVVLTNIGGSTLEITSIAVAGTNATSFVFANSCGTSLAAGASCTIHGHFAPTTAGALTAAITITDNASNSPQSIALSGTGVKPPVTLSAASLAFGSVDVGKSSNSQSVTMTNTGTAALSITGIAVTGANASSFVFANSCGTSLAVGVSCSIHGHFAPTTAGAWKAAITITDSATGSPQSIALSGTGVAPAVPVTLSAASLSFPATKVGSSSASQSVTMTNTGTAALTITSIAVTGTNASSFVFANTCGASLAVGDSCTIHGHFAPTATGALKAAVTITDSAMGSPQNIALSGTGQ